MTEATQDFLVQQIAVMLEDIADLKNSRVTHRAARVVGADAGSSEFSVVYPDGQAQGGLKAPPQFLPAVGQWVTLTLQGGTPRYEPAGISENAITGRELSTGAVTVEQLAFDIEQYTGGNKIYRGPDEPEGEQTVGNMWLKEIEPGEHITMRWEGDTLRWQEVQDQRVTKALEDALAAQTAATNAATAAGGAQSTADRKTQTFRQADAPPTTGRTIGDEWINIGVGMGNRRSVWTGTGWTLVRAGNEAIEPGSLIASMVISTGTITAPLLEAILILASVIILGDPNGNHQRLDSKGARVFRTGPDGQLVESGRSGYGPGDYMAGGGTANGSYAWMIPENGVASFQGMFVGSDPLIMGRPFTKWLSAAPGSGNGQPEIKGAQHYIGWAPGGLNGITNEVGIIEMAVDVSKDRWYWVGFDVGYRRQETNEIALRIRDGGASMPTMSSPEIMKRTITDGQGFATNTAFRMGIWYPQEDGVHRLGLTAATQAGGVTDVLNDPVLPAMMVIDMGPRKSILASVNRMGGGTNPPPSPAAPVKEHYRDVPAGAWASSRWSDGAPHPSATGPVQGYTQYAPQNGNSRGHWTFALPPIAGEITRMDFYVISEHWHFDTGGTAIFNIAITGNPYVKPMPDWEIGGYPKGNEKTVTLPRDWWPFFRNGGANGYARADGITVGSLSAGTNPMYYGRFSAQRAALRIWWNE